MIYVLKSRTGLDYPPDCDYEIIYTSLSENRSYEVSLLENEISRSEKSSLRWIQVLGLRPQYNNYLYTIFNDDAQYGVEKIEGLEEYISSHKWRMREEKINRIING